MQDIQDKMSSTGSGLSRGNSLASLPDTECDWPDTDTTQLPMSFDGMPSMSPIAAPSTSASTTFYQVSFLGGIEVRSAPFFDAPRTGTVLMQNKVFAVSQQIAGSDGRIYLCLADGQGWVFDDSALVPQDPSVVQLPFEPITYTGMQKPPTPPPPPLPAPSSESIWPTHLNPEMPVSPSQPLLSAKNYTPASLPAGLIGPPNTPPPLQQPRSTACHHDPPPPPSHLAPGGELLASSAPSHASSAGELLAMPAPAPVAWYRVAYLGGIMLRCAPSVESPWTGVTLPQMEVFAVAEELPAPDGRLYLRLCDGRGWAFDDSALMPQDPSVKRGKWMPSGDAVDSRVLREVQAADAAPFRRRHPQPRGKRGGKRCSRRSKAAAAQAAAPAGQP